MGVTMNISENGIAFTKESEGFQSVPKLDVGGDLVWGYGHDQQPGEVPPQNITEPQADTLLRQDYSSRYVPQTNAILSLLGYTANQNQFDALCDFCFNEGMGHLHEMLRHGWNQVPTQMLRWHFAGGRPVSGLLSRREKELQLFQS